MAATARQPLHLYIPGPGLFAHMPASSLGRGRTSTPSFFLGLRANSSRRGPRGDVEQALKVKGSSLVPKVGTKVKNIRLADGDHAIDCKIDGIGPMKPKSGFVRKA
jgi:hypothetical protein